MKKFVLISIAFVFILGSCQKNWDQIAEDNQTNSVNTELETMSDMVVSSEFNWKTTKDITLNLSGFNKDDIICINSIDGNIYQKAFVNSGDNYNTKITIPTYASELKLIYNGKTINISVSGNEINYKFV